MKRAGAIGGGLEPVGSVDAKQRLAFARVIGGNDCVAVEALLGDSEEGRKSVGGIREITREHSDQLGRPPAQGGEAGADAGCRAAEGRILQDDLGPERRILDGTDNDNPLGLADGHTYALEQRHAVEDEIGLGRTVKPTGPPTGKNDRVECHPLTS